MQARAGGTSCQCPQLKIIGVIPPEVPIRGPFVPLGIVQPSRQFFLQHGLQPPSIGGIAVQFLEVQRQFGSRSRIKEFAQMPFHGMPQQYDAEGGIPSRIEAGTLPIHGGKFLFGIVNRRGMPSLLGRRVVRAPKRLHRLVHQLQVVFVDTGQASQLEEKGVVPSSCGEASYKFRGGSWIVVMD